MTVMVAGDDEFEAAFADLFLRSARAARRLIGDPGVSEEIAAEALARAYAHWPRVQALPYREAWVLRVATNLAIDQLRRKAPVQHGRELIEVEDVSALRVTLAVALDQLPRRQREVVVLRYLTGLSDAEVAAATGLSLGTVKTHLRRGLGRLRTLLTDKETIPFAN